jgi:spore coat polysaccharide biosynthesis protein SpsF
MNTLIVIQARMASTRLPGKVLLPLAGRPLLERMLERVLAASSPFELCVATSAHPQDDPIRALCQTLGVRVFGGNPLDLLDRHYRAALAFGADAVVKIPSDCPLIDPAAIDRVLEHFHAERAAWDFVTNLCPPSWPDGNDVEVMSMATLETAWRFALRPFEREHTTPFIWERPERFRCSNVAWESGLDFSKSHRFTIDYVEDYALIARIYEELWGGERVFSLSEILDLLERSPEILSLNARFHGQSWQQNHLEELTRVVRSGTGLTWRVA